MGTNECSQPASKSSWDSQDFGDISMVLKMAHFRKSTGPQWVNIYSLSMCGSPMIKIRRYHNRLIFILGIPLLGRRYLYMKTAPNTTDLIQIV